MFEWLFIGFWLFFIANLLLVIWALVDAIRVPDDSMYEAGNKLIWVLVILLGGLVGSIVYLVVGRPSSTSRRFGPGTPTDPNMPPPPAGTVR